MITPLGNEFAGSSDQFLNVAVSLWSKSASAPDLPTLGIYLIPFSFLLPREVQLIPHEEVPLQVFQLPPSITVSGVRVRIAYDIVLAFKRGIFKSNTE